MKRALLYILSSLAFLSGCQKHSSSERVEIFILKSFTANISQTNPSTISFSNAALQDEPFVADADIQFYNRATTTFKLKVNIQPVVRDYTGDKAFAVTVNAKPIYFGLFHPGYLSSTIFGIATIDPVLLRSNELQIQFANIDMLYTDFDKRNDDLIINTLKKTNRIR